MATIQGISGMQMGDGAGGKVALSIQKQVLRILSDNILSYATATALNPASVKAGTATYYVPELIGAEAYGTGTSKFHVPQSGLLSFNLDTRRTVKWEVETFDLSRLNESDYIMGMISTGIAMAIQADLNGQFWKYLVEKFDKNTGDSKLKTQVLSTDYLTKKNKTIDPDTAFGDYIQIEYLYNDINQTFDKNKLGIPKAEIMAIFAPIVDTNLKIAFRNQPNAIGEYQINKSLSGKKIGNLIYTTDPMLNKNIPANSSFNNDQALDFTKIFGFIFHNEAIAMPINLEQIWHGTNPENANPRFIAKYQFGIGLIRPSIIYKLVDSVDALSEKEVKKAEKEAKAEN